MGRSIILGLPWSWWAFGGLTEYPRTLRRIKSYIQNDIGAFGFEISLEGMTNYICGAMSSGRAANMVARCGKRQPMGYYIVRVPWKKMYDYENLAIQAAPDETRTLLGEGTSFTEIAAVWLREHGEYRSWHYYACRLALGMAKLRMVKDWEMPQIGERNTRNVREQDTWGQHQMCGRDGFQEADDEVW